MPTQVDNKIAEKDIEDKDFELTPAYTCAEPQSQIDLELTLVYTGTEPVSSDNRTFPDDKVFEPIGFHLQVQEIGFGTVAQLDCNGKEHAYGVRDGDRVVDFFFFNYSFVLYF